LPDVSPYDEELWEDFDELFVDWFADMGDFAQQHFDGLGFDTASKQTVKEHDIPEGTVVLNPRTLIESLNEEYDIVGLADKVYVFNKETKTHD
jgi:hypothetical protein